MKTIRAIIKIIFHISILVVFAGFSILGILVIFNAKKRSMFHSQAVSFFSKLCLIAMNVKVTVKGAPSNGQHYLVVANHLGFIDILVVAAARHALFITSLDMKETPGLGHLTQMGGCLYVDRRNRSNIQKEILIIRDVLEQGHNVVLFPESVSTNGEKVLPFKKTLMTAAAGTGVPILPAVINFRKINGEPMSHKWRDSVFWYGDMSFFGAGWRAHTLKSIEVDLEFLNPILCHNDEQRHEVAANAQSQIEALYMQIPIPHDERIGELAKTSI